VSNLVQLPQSDALPDGWRPSTLFANEWIRIIRIVGKDPKAMGCDSSPYSVVRLASGCYTAIIGGVRNDAMSARDAAMMAERAYCNCHVRKT
jgi:hypothetical protein